MNITLLENHWYGATFSPSARFGGDDENGHGHEDTTPEAHGGEEYQEGGHEDSTARRLAMAAVVPMVVAGVAVGVVAARRIQARRAAHADELRRIEVDAIEYANDIAE
ncbi:hypothetical protein [Haloglomus halophilum]|uniref:hypothetical protein n=1 Tax=Haloglomus halophilum TaxID=2962672 RepID=UPI0020C9CADF|nr:hypothetical protein [Haloglomus halophilum]